MDKRFKMIFKRLILISVICMSLSAYTERGYAQLRLGNEILHQSTNCDIRKSGLTALRCAGSSHRRGQFNTEQMATLIFTCNKGYLSVSLGHAMVEDEVKKYRFENDKGQSKGNDDHIRVSKVRTTFAEPRNTAPRWIYQNVTDQEQMTRLYFWLNDSEINGEFQFDSHDSVLFSKFSQLCSNRL